MSGTQPENKTPKKGAFTDALLILAVIGLLAKIWSIVVVVANLNSRLLISPSRYPLLDLTSSIPLAAALWFWALSRNWSSFH